MTARQPAPGGPRSEGAAARRPSRGARDAPAFMFSNRALAVAIGVFAIGYLVLAFQIPEYTAVAVPVQPGTLPRWLGVLLLGLAVFLFLQRGSAQKAATTETSAQETDTATASEAEAEPEASAEPAEPLRLGRLADPRWEVALFVAALCVYVALFEPLGFLLATALYLGAMITYLGYRRPVVIGVISVGLPLAMYLGMSVGLGVILPSGLLPF